MRARYVLLRLQWFARPRCFVGHLGSLRSTQLWSLLLSAEGEPWYLSNGVQPEAGSDRVFTLVLPIAQEQQ